MTEVAEAEALILAHMPRFPARQEPLAACVGRVLAEDIHAERDQPPFDRVTMDGIAIALPRLRGRRALVRGRRHAGRRRRAARRRCGAMRRGHDGHGRCRAARTPSCRSSACNAAAPWRRSRPMQPVAAEQFVHRRGSDRAQGSLVLRAGTRLGPPEIAVLAGAGHATALVADLPRVAVISTGDELVDAGKPIAPHQIRSTNDRAVEASLTQHRLGSVTRARLRDDANALAVAIDRLDTRARRARLERRHLDGPVRLRAVRAHGARREARASQGRAAAGPADVVRRQRARQADLRAARQPGLDARLRDALSAAGVAARVRPRGRAAGARRDHGAHRSVADADACSRP